MTKQTLREYVNSEHSAIILFLIVFWIFWGIIGGSEHLYYYRGTASFSNVFLFKSIQTMISISFNQQPQASRRSFSGILPASAVFTTRIRIVPVPVGVEMQTAP